jgi:GntR family transcriptional regulator, transcriptional repressor for pyruvate dehydrogenase complex
MKQAEDHRPLFETMKRKRTFEEVSAHIKSLVLKGVLKPGAKLPPETEIARQLGVGRQTVREAFRLLELSGFVRIKRGLGGGPVIADTVLDSLSTALHDAVALQRVNIDELTDARVVVEKGVIERLLQKMDPADMAHLRENITQAKSKIAMKLPAFEENIQFHILLATASRNQVFVVTMRAIMTIMADFLSRRKQTLSASKKVVDAHEEILEAVINGRKEESIRKLEEHLLDVGKRLELSLKQRTAKQQAEFST